MLSRSHLAPYIRVPMRYGLYGGGISFAFTVLLYRMGHHPMLIPPFFDYRIPLLGLVLFFSLKEARDYHGMTQFFFWQGLIGSGVLMIFFTAVVSLCLYTYIALDSEFLHSYITLSLAQLNTFSKQDIDRIGQSNYAEAVQLLQRVTGGSLVVLRALQSCIIGTFMSIIIAVILRKNIHKSHG